MLFRRALTVALSLTASVTSLPQSNKARLTARPDFLGTCSSTYSGVIRKCREAWKVSPRSSITETREITVRDTRVVSRKTASNQRRYGQY
jgi:hypothetical protein